MSLLGVSIVCFLFYHPYELCTRLKASLHTGTMGLLYFLISHLVIVFSRTLFQYEVGLRCLKYLKQPASNVIERSHLPFSRSRFCKNLTSRYNCFHNATTFGGIGDIKPKLFSVISQLFIVKTKTTNCLSM